MYLNAFRIRIGMIGAGLLTMCLYLAMGGRFGPGKNGAIQIEYGAYPDEFQGLPVEIDGEVVGTLRPFGSATRTGFEVREGDHRVRVIHPKLASEARNVTVRAGSGVMLILNTVERMDAKGGSRPTIGFES